MNQIVNHKTFVPAAVYSSTPHDSRSSNYAHVSTERIMNLIETNGFELAGASARRVRKADKEGFQKHLLRFRPIDSKLKVIGDSVPEIIVSNAHDGTGGINIMAGLFRLVCLNGLVVKSAEFATVSLPHRGRDLESKVIDAAYTVIQDSERAAIAVQDWRGLNMNRLDQLQFAKEALDIKYANADRVPVEPFQLLQARRSDDSDNNLWTVFNVVQENIVRGGLRGRIGERTVTTRQIRGAEADVSINSKLWGLADRWSKELV
jgi:hypothetical protein